jgi:hypothetical protein
MLIPTQPGIEQWKYDRVAEPYTWKKSDGGIFQPGDEVNFSEEPIVVLHADFGTQGGTYILSGHVRSRYKADNGEDIISSIRITTSNYDICEKFWIMHRMAGIANKRRRVTDLPIFKGTEKQ